MLTENWSDSTGNYIRIPGDDRDRISDGMITGGCIDGICPVSIEKVNGHREYVYDVSGYMSLIDYMEETGVSKRTWIHILRKLCDLISETEKHLLDGEHLVLEPDCIYVRGDEPELIGIYVAEYKKDLGESVMNLMEKALKCPEADREISEFIYRLHGLCAKTKLTRKDLMVFLDSESNEEKAVADRPLEKKNDKSYRKPLRTDFERISSISGKSTSEKGKRLHFLPKKSISGKIIGFCAGPKLLPIGVLTAGFLIPLVLAASGMFTSRTTGQIEMTSAAAAFLFFMSVGGYGAWRLWPKDEKHIVVDVEESVSVCMIPRDAGCRVIPVEKYPFSFGSDGKKCDAVVESASVSPLHAVLKREGKAVFITDQESSSGTYRNDERVVPWAKVRLKDGDIVAFGSVRYVVEIS